jgi:hypothetical protein
VFVVGDFDGDGEALVSSELVVEPDASFDAVQGVVDGLVAVEEVASCCVVGVVDEGDGDGFVEEEVVAGWGVGVAPVLRVEGVGDEEEGSGDADLGGDVDDLFAGVDQTDVVAWLDRVAVGGAGYWGDGGVRQVGDDEVAFLGVERDRFAGFVFFEFDEVAHRSAS